MASAYGILHNYGEPQNKLDYSLQLQGLEYRQKMYDANEVKLEQAMNSLGIQRNQIVNTAAKEKLDQNVHDFLNKLNNTGELDLSSSASTKSIIGDIGKILDPETVYHIGKGREIANYSAKFEELREKEGGKYYNENNYAYGLAMAGYSDYVNGGTDARLGRLEVIPYKDVHKEMNESIFKMMSKAGTKEYRDGDGMIRQIKEFTPLEARNFVMANLDDKAKKQLEINSWATTQGLTSEQLEQHSENYYLSKLNVLQADIKAARRKRNSGDPTEAQHAQRTLEQLERHVAELNRDYSEMRQSTQGMNQFLGTQSFIDEMINSYSSVIDDKYKKDPLLSTIETANSRTGVGRRRGDEDYRRTVSLIGTDLTDDESRNIIERNRQIFEQENEKANTRLDTIIATIESDPDTRDIWSNLIEDPEKLYKWDEIENEVYRKAAQIEEYKKKVGADDKAALVIDGDIYEVDEILEDYRQTYEIYQEISQDFFEEEWENSLGDLYDKINSSLNPIFIIDETGNRRILQDYVKDITKDEFLENKELQNIIRKNMSAEGLIDDLSRLNIKEADIKGSVLQINNDFKTFYSLDDIFKAEDKQGKEVSFEEAINAGVNISYAPTSSRRLAGKNDVLYEFNEDNEIGRFLKESLKTHSSNKLIGKYFSSVVGTTLSDLPGYFGKMTEERNIALAERYLAARDSYELTIVKGDEIFDELLSEVGKVPSKHDKGYDLSSGTSITIRQNLADDQFVDAYMRVIDPGDRGKYSYVKVGEYDKSNIENIIGVPLTAHQGSPYISKPAPILSEDFGPDSLKGNGIFKMAATENKAERGVIIPASAKEVSYERFKENPYAIEIFEDPRFKKEQEQIKGWYNNMENYVVKMDPPIEGSTRAYIQIGRKNNDGNIDWVETLPTDLSLQSYDTIRNTIKYRPAYFVEKYFERRVRDFTSQLTNY